MNPVKQLYLANGADFDETMYIINSEYGIKVRQYDDFVLLDYDQLKSPKTHELSMFCRGVIIDKQCNVVCKSFDRFFNFGEAVEITSQVNLSDCVVFDKADGSLIRIWYNKFDKKWEIATRGTALGEGELIDLEGKNISFRQLFLKTINLEEDQFQAAMNAINLSWQAKWYEDFTYVFELCTAANKVVTTYENDCVFFTGMINNKTLDDLEEFSPVFRAAERQFKIAFDNCLPNERFYTKQMCKPESIIDMVNSREGLKEGFVVRCMDTGIRLKIKSTQYVIAHRLKGEFRIPRNQDLLELIQIGEVDEFIAYFPEFKDRIDDLKEAVVVLKWNLVDEFMKIIRTIGTNTESTLERREFKKLLSKTISESKFSEYAWILFKLADNQDIDSIFSEMSLQKLVRTMRLD